MLTVLFLVEKIRRFSPSENSEGEKRRPEIRLRFAGYLPAGMLFTKRNEN